MKNVSAKQNWFWGDITSRVENKPITLINMDKVLVNKDIDYIKAKLCRNPA